MQTECTQGSLAWQRQRLGFVTASRFADILTPPRTKTAKENGELSQTALSYFHQLIGDHLAGTPAIELDTAATRWGRQWEPNAREAFMWRHGSHVSTCGFIPHPAEPWIGGTPDGLVGEDSVLEIKCPLTRANHIEVLLSGEIPKEHVTQVQGEMWVSGRPRAYFVSYHPDFEAPHNLAIVEVSLSDEPFLRDTILDMADKVCRFRDRLVNRLKEIISCTSSK